VKVKDFGIARSIETTRTTTGVMVGTPAYMALEQAENKTADTRSDIYSLGLVLYEILTEQSASEPILRRRLP
jgi:serine/threonine protein kinase